jgi:hypothetical protein
MERGDVLEHGLVLIETNPVRALIDRISRAASRLMPKSPVRIPLPAPIPLVPSGAGHRGAVHKQGAGRLVPQPVPVENRR